MLSKGATEKRIINIGRDLIVINQVKGDESLQRVMINSVFCGYMQMREGKHHRLDGHNIHDLVFAKICQLIE